MRILGDLESEVMNIVWREQVPIAVREVAEKLQKKREIAYTTVMTVMSRLVEKGILTRKPRGASYYYKTAVPRDTFVANTVHRVFTTTVSALGEASAAYFIKEIQKLPSKKRRELVRILDNEKGI